MSKLRNPEFPRFLFRPIRLFLTRKTMLINIRENLDSFAEQVVGFGEQDTKKNAMYFNLRK